jgi:hypothetical protein
MLEFEDVFVPFPTSYTELGVDVVDETELMTSVSDPGADKGSTVSAQLALHTVGSFGIHKANFTPS